MFCPKCGGDQIAGLFQEYCHCGHCGLSFMVELMAEEQTGEVSEEDDAVMPEKKTEKAEEKKAEAEWEFEPEFEQMSLF